MCSRRGVVTIVFMCILGCRHCGSRRRVLRGGEGENRYMILGVWIEILLS